MIAFFFNGLSQCFTGISPDNSIGFSSLGSKLILFCTGNPGQMDQQ